MNFVVAYTPRAGGNVVAEFLSHQKNLHCHGNIFPYNGVISLKDSNTLEDIEINFDKLMELQKWPAAVRKMKEAQNLTNLLLKEKNRYENVPSILKILEKTEKKTKVGFKLSLKDYETLPPNTKAKLFKQLSKENTKLILLDRKNQFEQYVSMELCERYNRHIRKSVELPKLQKIGIKPAEYLAFKKELKKNKEKFIQDLIKFGINFKEYFYEELKDETLCEGTYKNILEYLEESPDDYIDASDLIPLKRVNIYPPNITVSNYSNVIQFLRAKNDPEFI